MTLIDQLNHKILILDGAMGTMIRSLHLREATKRGLRCTNRQLNLLGNYDLLNITASNIISDIHQSYVDAGADIICTNTFASCSITQAQYGLSHMVEQLNVAGASIARNVADACPRKVWVAGTIGPTTTAPHSINNSEEYNKLSLAFEQQASCLINSGVDLILLETFFDVMVAQAALDAIERIDMKRHTTIPVMISITIKDSNGITPTGVAALDFYESVAHYPILSFGFNCSMGVVGMEQPLIGIAQTVRERVSLHPNAGLPDANGNYSVTPQLMARHMAHYASEGMINIAGGCCGTTPEHIKAIAQALHNITPRKVVI